MAYTWGFFAASLSLLEAKDDRGMSTLEWCVLTGFGFLFAFFFWVILSVAKIQTVNVSCLVGREVCMLHCDTGILESFVGTILFWEQGTILSAQFILTRHRTSLSKQQRFSSNRCSRQKGKMKWTQASASSFFVSLQAIGTSLFMGESTRTGCTQSCWMKLCAGPLPFKVSLTAKFPLKHLHSNSFVTLG